MSYYKNTRKEDLINVFKEIGEQATSKEIIIQLKTKLEKFAAFKDDLDFVMNLPNFSVEGRQTKAEQQLQVINLQLELEKIKLQQIEREIEFQKALAKGQATHKSSKGDTKNLENLIKSVKTMESENKNKNTDYTVNRIETSMPNQNNFLFHELQYVDVSVDDIPLSITLDSGANSVIINTKYISEEKKNSFPNRFKERRWERGNQRVNEGEGFSERTLDAEVDDPGLRKERRERWQSRDTPTVAHEREA
ncbi:hypothetical protein TNCV_1559551 [Trichonephila clavipes]|nr:hypothetical protein TNCV_1559551 [Trichonephila clavipes]